MDKYSFEVQYFKANFIIAANEVIEAGGAT
jgi:hypothetical protein